VDRLLIGNDSRRLLRQPLAQILQQRLPPHETRERRHVAEHIRACFAISDWIRIRRWLGLCGVPRNLGNNLCDLIAAKPLPVVDLHVATRLNATDRPRAVGRFDPLSKVRRCLAGCLRRLGRGGMRLLARIAILIQLRQIDTRDEKRRHEKTGCSRHECEMCNINDLEAKGDAGNDGHHARDREQAGRPPPQPSLGMNVHRHAERDRHHRLKWTPVFGPPVKVDSGQVFGG
jgi:hypothetical protein